MTIDRGKLDFYSGDPIDKVVVEGSISVSVSAATSGSTTAVLQTVPHTYGSKGFPSVNWSMDGTNFYDGDTQLLTSTGFTIDGVTAGADASNLYFYVQNSETSAKTFTIRYALDSLT